MSDNSDFIQDMFVNCLHILNRHSTPEWGFHEENLPYYNIMFIYDGEGIFIRNGKKEIVEKGDFVFYRKGDSRYISTNPNNLLKFYAVNFLYNIPCLLSDTWSFNNIDLPIEFVTSFKKDNISWQLERILDKLCRVHISNIPIKRQKERALFIEMLQLFFWYKDIDNNHITYANRKKVEHIIDYMTKHFEENIAISDLALLEGISISYLGRIFKEITNQTPVTYLNIIRINKAKILLAEGMSVAETAERSGFKDVYYFSRIFKQYEGIAPSQYNNTNTI